MLWIDPPSGWLYGFPKPYTHDRKKETIQQWLLQNGYPQYELDRGGANHIRFIGPIEELREVLDELRAPD